MSGVTLNLQLSSLPSSTMGPAGSHEPARENSAFAEVLGVLDRREGGGEPVDPSTAQATQGAAATTVRAAAPPGEAPPMRFTLGRSATPTADAPRFEPPRP